MSKKNIKKFSSNHKKKDTKPEIKKEERSPLNFFIKIAILGFIIISAVLFSDLKGYFNPSEKNNHTLKKWNAFYDFTRRNNVDILLLGNSHLYTGINPKNLSINLGANAFILASPGTFISDIYYSLKEALKKCKPNLVIVETYSIRGFDPYKLKSGALSDQFKSFSARRDLQTKLISTPNLFSTDNYFYAWSNTIRNHDYIFTNQTQIKKNKESIGKELNNKKKLYLGRYVRFKSGLQDSVLQKYQIEGAPVDGKSYKYNNYAENYCNKIRELCKKEGIELMFVTVPMYHKHISDYSVWKTRLAEIIDTDSIKWLDMQDPYSIKDFAPYCFENSYSLNQHLTYQGSLVATYKLADFIRNEIKVNLPNRKKEQKWINQFYGEEGYFENMSPNTNDKENVTICKNISIRNIAFEEVLLLLNENKKSKKIIAKIKIDNSGNYDLRNYVLKLVIKFNEKGQVKNAVVELQYDRLHEFKNKAIFVQNIKTLDVVGVVDAAIERRL